MPPKKKPKLRIPAKLARRAATVKATKSKTKKTIKWCGSASVKAVKVAKPKPKAPKAPKPKAATLKVVKTYKVSSWTTSKSEHAPLFKASLVPRGSVFLGKDLEWWKSSAKSNATMYWKRVDDQTKYRPQGAVKFVNPKGLVNYGIVASKV